MPGPDMMKMMKKAMMEGQRVASMEGKHGASVALGTGADCPRTSLYIVPGNPARDTRKNPREKEYGPTSHFVTVRLSQRAQPGPLLRTMKPSSHTPCSLSTGSQGSLSGSLTVPMATLTPRAHRSMARELTSLAGLPGARPYDPTPVPPPDVRGNLAVPSLHFRPSARHHRGHQAHLFMPRFRLTVPHRCSSRRP